MNMPLSRRQFVAGAAAVGVGLTIGRAAQAAEKPALLGGTPLHTEGWPGWPDWHTSWEADIIDILRSGQWYRGSDTGHIAQFETAYAQLMGARRCLATASGTTALITAMHVLDVDAGDEVICSPFTFNATYNAILMHKALPVFADTSPATLTIDPASIESRITERTRAIVPVHIYGMPCDMQPIQEIARKHQLVIVEDACQAWLAEYRGRKCGTLGDLGCFSFQNSKHITSGEGGAITGDSDEWIDRCHAFHNCGRASGTIRGSGSFTRGSNFRMQHLQAAMLLHQIDKLVRDTHTRQANADYLTNELQDVPGLAAAELPADSRAVWHLFPLRYDAAHFQGLTRHKFIQALRAEGIPCSGGYHEQYFDGMFDETIQSRGFQRLWSAEQLRAYRASFDQLHGTRQACQTTVVLPQNVLLADRHSMDHVIEAIRRIHAHAGDLATA